MEGLSYEEIAQVMDIPIGTVRSRIFRAREAIAAKTLRDSGYAVSPDDVVVTNGGKQAVFQAFAALVDPGDEVILPTPYWTTYPEVIALAGGRAVEVFAGADQDYKVTVDQLEAARTPRTISADKLTAEAIEMMETFRINQLPVVNAAGELIGALNMHDLFRAKAL